VGNKKEYIERLRMVIRQLHGCDSTRERSEPVHETFQGATVWDGHVEVFAGTHPKAQSAYAWSDADANFTAVLGIPPAIDPQSAVKVSIVAAVKKGEA
jgi:hypothetical protein